MDQKKIKRFYKNVETQDREDGFAITLDGRPIKTPNRGELTLPTLALADQIAAEWAAQVDQIDAASMPLTRIANSAIDHVGPNHEVICQEIVRYAGSDLVCYREDTVKELRDRQEQNWDPFLIWIEKTHGVKLVTAPGILHVAQNPEALEGVSGLMANFDAFRLACLHMATTLTGSAVIALALESRFVDVDEAWAAARLDEIWQQEKWGVDDEAAARAEGRLAELRDASRFLDLLAS